MSRRNLLGLSSSDDAALDGVLSDCCHDYGEEAEGLVLADVRVGWVEVARRCSEVLGGQWIPGDDGITWQCGRRTAWLQSRWRYPVLLEARRCCLALGAEPRWTVGGCCRSLLGWLGVSQPAEPAAELLVMPWADWDRRRPSRGKRPKADGRVAMAWGLVSVEPGTWPSGDLWDVRSCYWTLWDRLPALTLSYRPERGILWGSDGPLVASKRRALSECVGTVKGLRNAITGAAAGSSAGCRFYCRGEVGTLPGGSGPLRPAALLVFRSMWELAREAADQTSSRYTHVDCVVATGGEYPQVWEDAGLTFDVKASGDVEVCNSISRRVGLDESIPYRRGSRLPESIPVPRPPRREVWREWAA